jgi:hypothetical protein
MKWTVAADDADWKNVARKRLSIVDTTDLQYDQYFKSASVSINGREIQGIQGKLASVFDSSSHQFMDTQKKSLLPKEAKVAGEVVTSYIPLTFWFTTEFSQSLPLISLVHQTASVKIDLAEANKTVKLIDLGASGKTYTFTTNIESADLVADMIYLDNEQRKKMATEDKSYLIHQTQELSSSILGSHVQLPLYFKHPVTSVFWRLLKDNGDSTEIVKEAQITANGHNITEMMDGTYFRYIQNYQSINHKEPADSGYYMYSWAKKPLSVQPSGSINMSRLENVMIKMELENSNDAKSVEVFAFNFNVLTFSNGMGGLLFN